MVTTMRYWTLAALGSTGLLPMLARPAVTVRADDDLGIGDQSASFTIGNDSAEHRFDSTLLFTRVGNRAGMIVCYRSGGPDSGLALAAMADALGQ